MVDFAIMISEPDPYSFMFSKETSKEFFGSEVDRLFLEAHERYANHLLKTRGHVFLNDVLDLLGIKRTRTGTITGWIVFNDDDTYISFGAVEDDEENFSLCFNVQGVIADKI